MAVAVTIRSASNLHRRHHEIPVGTTGAARVVAAGSRGHPVLPCGPQKPAAAALRGPGLKNPTKLRVCGHPAGGAEPVSKNVYGTPTGGHILSLRTRG
jgi:hypothetical protein